MPVETRIPRLHVQSEPALEWVIKYLFIEEKLRSTLALYLIKPYKYKLQYVNVTEAKKIPHKV